MGDIDDDVHARVDVMVKFYRLLFLFLGAFFLFGKGIGT